PRARAPLRLRRGRRGLGGTAGLRAELALMGAQVRGAFLPSAALVLALVGCVGAPPEGPFPLSLPPGFPAPQVPEANPLTAARIELGRHLFYDERISGNGTQSCASCHRQERAFADGLIQPAGSTGVLHPRNSPSLTNAA